MAKRGGILRAIGHIFGVGKDQPRETPQPIEEPETNAWFPSNRYNGEERELRSTFTGYRNNPESLLPYASYSDWREMFGPLSNMLDIEEASEEEVEAWDKFLNAYFPWEGNDAATWDQRREQFADFVGISPNRLWTLVDWDEWRAEMKNTNGSRSR